MSRLAARNADASRQGEFDFILPIEGTLQLLHPDYVARIIGHERTMVYDLMQEGLLETHRRPGSEKSHLRITRRSACAYIADSAQYEPADYANTLFRLAQTLTVASRRALAQRLLSQT